MAAHDVTDFSLATGPVPVVTEAPVANGVTELVNTGNRSPM